MKRPVLFASFCFAALMTTVGTQTFAQVITITVDEQGNGTLLNPVSGTFVLPSSVQTDPGPGGLVAALTYNLLNPPGLVIGDVLITEPGGINLTDLIRFNPNGTMVFYSDTSEGVDSLADRGFPTALYTNNITIPEVGPEGNNGAFYTPTPNQPGYVAGAAFPVTYHFISDSAVPEPGPIALVGLMGALGGTGYAWRLRKPAA